MLQIWEAGLLDSKGLGYSSPHPLLYHLPTCQRYTRARVSLKIRKRTRDGRWVLTWEINAGRSISSVKSYPRPPLLYHLPTCHRYTRDRVSLECTRYPDDFINENNFLILYKFFQFSFLSVNGVVCWVAHWTLNRVVEGSSLAQDTTMFTRLPRGTLNRGAV